MWAPLVYFSGVHADRVALDRWHGDVRGVDAIGRHLDDGVRCSKVRAQSTDPALPLQLLPHRPLPTHHSLRHRPPPPAPVPRPNCTTQLPTASCAPPPPTFTRTMGRSQALLLLLTENVLRQPCVLVEVAHALRMEVPIVPVCVVGGGYDFESARRQLSGLHHTLDEGAMDELRRALRADDLTVPQISGMLASALPSIIAISYPPNGTPSEVDAALNDIISRVARTKKAIAALRKVALPATLLHRATSAVSSISGRSRQVAVTRANTWRSEASASELSLPAPSPCASHRSENARATSTASIELSGELDLGESQHLACEAGSAR